MKKSTRSFIFALVLAVVASVPMTISAGAEPRIHPANMPVAAAGQAISSAPAAVSIDGRGRQISAVQSNERQASPQVRQRCVRPMFKCLAP